MKINCSYTKLVQISELIPNPRNPNRHTPEQIERLSKLIQEHGQRLPVIVSLRSGFIVAGHGRIESMRQLGWERCAVDYQDFENEEQEYQFLVADNAIADWATLDFSQINTDIQELGPFNLELLGIKDFTVEPLDKDQGKTKKEKLCPHCGGEI